MDKHVSVADYGVSSLIKACSQRDSQNYACDSDVLSAPRKVKASTHKSIQEEMKFGTRP